MTKHFERESIIRALHELADSAAESGITATVCLIGGAAIELLLGNRGSTRDIDSIIYGRGALDACISEVATRHGWPSDWLNVNASMFASDYDDPHMWEEFLVNHGVTFRIAPARVLVAMKLRAGRGLRDFGDLELLLQHLGWNRSQAEEAFDALYPHDVLHERSRRFLAAWTL